MIGKSRLHLVRAAMISGGSCSPAWAVRQVRLSREVRSAVTKNPTAITMKMTPRATVTDVVQLCIIHSDHQMPKPVIRNSARLALERVRDCFHVKEVVMGPELGHEIGILRSELR